MKLAEAIRHAEQVADSYKDTAPDCRCAVEHRQLAEWLKELQGFQWIPVEERLPRDGEKILACYDDGYMLVMQFYAGARFSFIAWMPLPEPWKGADDE